jgi:hypothetical protein
LLDDPKIASKVPKQEYCEASRLATLSQLGLQTRMSRGTFLDVIRRSNDSKPDQVKLDRAHKLWDYLQEEWTNFTANNQSSAVSKFVHELTNVPWLPIMQMLEGYELPWYQSKAVLTSASKSRPKKDRDLVSSNIPIADVQFVDALRYKISAALGWDKPPSSTWVLNHLQLVVKNYNPATAGVKVTDTVQKIAHKVYDLLDKDSQWDPEEFKS